MPLPNYNMNATAAAPHAAAPTPNSPVNPYVASVTGTSGNYVPGFSSDTGVTDYNGFINATVGAPPGTATPNTPVYGSGGPPATAPTTPTVQPSPSPFDTDPGYAAAKAAEQLGIPSINTSLQNLIAQRIASYGDPHLAEMAGFGLDPQSAAFAQQNYLSGNAQLARLDKAHTQARQAVINQLAGHGLLFSGDTGYQTGQADQTYGNNVYDAQQQALADILGYRNTAQSQKDTLHTALTSALENAYQTVLAHPETASVPPMATQPTSGQLSVKAPAPAAKKPAAAAKAVVQRLLPNAYTTGQKRFG